MQSSFKEVEKWLKRYYRNEILIAIKNRQDYVENPPSMVEELGVKVTTSFNTQSPQEKELTKSDIPDLINDYIYNQLVRVRYTIALFLDGCSEWEQELLRLKYKENKPWDYIVSELPFERTKLFTMRNDLICRLARNLAWIK